MNLITKKHCIERLSNERNCLVGSISVNRMTELVDIIEIIDMQKERLYNNCNTWRTLEKAYSNHLQFTGGSNLYFNSLVKCYEHEKFIICDDNYFRIIYLMN